MTQQTEKAKRQERREQFKLKDVEKHISADDSEMYNVVVYPYWYNQDGTHKRGRDGKPLWSQYTREMFLWGDDPKAIYETLCKLPKESIVTLHVVSGKVKQNKQDDGQFESYFWNVVGIADGQQVSPQPDPHSQPAKASDPVPQSATPGPGGVSSTVPPSLGGIANERDWAGPFYHDVTDEAHQARISWAQAVNLAVEAIGSFIDPNIERTEDGYLQACEWWANRFYPLIRKGPTVQEEPIFPDAQEGPQDAQGDGEETEETQGMGESPFHAAIAARKPFPVRGEKEAAVTYYLRVAKGNYGKEQAEALAAIGGSWLTWVNTHPGGERQEVAVQAGLKALAEV